MSLKQQDVPLEELDQRPQINVNDKPITDEPKASPAMKQEPQSNNENSQNLKSKESSNPNNGSSSSDSDSDSDSDDDVNSHFTATSGYQRESNECTEFCIECCTCFGVLNCCPNNGEGCVTNMATFIGNMLFACCKCWSS